VALIEMDNIKKNYHLGASVVAALKGVDLRINSGEFAAVWGPSGSGKTTLLNLIGAIDEPSSGRLCVGGEEILQLSDEKRTELRNRAIGFVFQGFNLVPVLSALENVMLPLQIKGVSARTARAKATERLTAVDLSDFVNHRPDKMSGGQQQRVAIARALVCDPSIVIADEPTANLDSVTAKNIIGLMRTLNRTEATTFIFSTHDQRLLNQVARLVRLEDGRIIADEAGPNSN